MKIEITVHGEDLRIEPFGKLNGEWGTFQAAVKVAGARNVREGNVWRTVAPFDRLRLLCRSLRHVGFEVVTDLDISEPEDFKERLRSLEEVSGLPLYPFQREGAEFLAGRERACLWDAMGVGKTAQALSALPDGAACLVVCPASLKAVWEREVERFRPDLEAQSLSGRGSFRWPNPGEVLIINYDILPTLAADAKRPDPRTILISDEAHALKNHKAQRTGKFRVLSEAVRSYGGAVWLLTGTPLLGKPPELWGVLGAAGLEFAAFGSWDSFVSLFDGQKVEVALGRYAYEWGTPDPSVAGRLRAISLRRTREEVLPELPVKRFELLVETEIRKTDAKVLDQVWAAINDAGIEKLPTFDGMSQARRILAACKAPLLDAIVVEHEAANEPLVVFSAHVEPMRELGARPGWGVITGEVPVSKRALLVDQFQRGELLGLACTIAAAGTGLTLTASAHVVFLDRDWTPALNEQAEDRLVRIGQTRGVIVTILGIDHPLDRRIMEVCGVKRALIDATVGASGRYRVIASAEKEKKPVKPRWQARTALERWATEALTILTVQDPDGAVARNEAGWNRLDGRFGRKLQAQLACGLTGPQWAAAIRMCRKYHRQVGAPPEERLLAGEVVGVDDDGSIVVEYVSKYPENGRLR